MSEDRVWALRSNLRVWSKLSEHRRSERNCRKSIDLRLADLDLTSLIYLSALPNQDDDNALKFVECVIKMVRIAGMLDDAMDLEDDVVNGIVGIEPSMKNKLMYLSRAIIEGLPMLRYHLVKDLVIQSVNIMVREFRRRKTVNNYEQYKI